MPVSIDRELREFMPHRQPGFPITYFHDELASLPGYTGPLHWHDDFEIAMADSEEIEYQVTEEHIVLDPGDVIFVNGNVLHRIRQISGNRADALPNVVFSGTVIASEMSPVFQKYIQPVYQDDTLSCIVFRHDDERHEAICRSVRRLFAAISGCESCYELNVQRELINLFEHIIRHFDEWPRTQASRVQMKTQIRMQRMLVYIHQHYAQNVTLADIAKAADISRSEASRCFRTYMDLSPVEFLLRCRVQNAREMLRDTSKTISEIAMECGFNSANYFSRQFKRIYLMTPGEYRHSLGK